MNLLTCIIFFGAIGSVFSLLGGMLLLFNKNINKVAHILSSFAAGALLGAVFFELLPEGVHQSEEGIGVMSFFMIVLAGIIVFYLLERVLHWQHNHDTESVKEPVVPMIIIGDTLHNFVDGIAIAAAFLVSIPLGIITALVVSAHEIPQEIGDFGVLLKKGLSRKKIILINLLSAFVSLIGALLTYFLGTAFTNLSIILIAISAGFFLYISLSNLIPEIHHENRRGFALGETIALLGGILITYVAITSLHNLLPDVHGHEEEIHSEEGLEHNEEIEIEEDHPEEAH